MDVDLLGGKDNLTDVNAVIGLHQLKQLPAFQSRRSNLARQYFDVIRAEMKSDGIEDLKLELPPENFTESNWHMFQIILPLPTQCRSRPSDDRTQRLGYWYRSALPRYY